MQDMDTPHKRTLAAVRRMDRPDEIVGYVELPPGTPATASNQLGVLKCGPGTACECQRCQPARQAERLLRLAFAATQRGNRDG